MDHDGGVLKFALLMIDSTWNRESLPRMLIIKGLQNFHHIESVKIVVANTQIIDAGTSVLMNLSFDFSVFFCHKACLTSA